MIVKIKLQFIAMYRNMKEFDERLQYLAVLKKLQQADLARALDKDPSPINKWWSGERVPGPKNMRLISNYFDCNYNWLKTGEGDPYPQKTTETTIETDAYGYPTGVTKTRVIGTKGKSSRIAELYKIPVLGNVPAGIPNTLEEYVEEYISVPNAPPNCYALKVDGESMEPGIRHGDYVLFVIDREPRSGDIVVVNDEFGDSMIKRYKAQGDEVRLISDNPAYPTYIPNDHYRIMGVVVGGWRELKI